MHSNVIPGLGAYPHLARAFDAELSAVTRQNSVVACNKCKNNAYLKVVRKYQKLLDDAKKAGPRLN